MSTTTTTSPATGHRSLNGLRRVCAVGILAAGLVGPGAALVVADDVAEAATSTTAGYGRCPGIHFRLVRVPCAW